MAILSVEHLQKVYTQRFGGVQTTALRDISLTVEEGEFVAIMGESGSGKSTLLNILATLDLPTGGSVLLNDRDTSKIPEKEAAEFRRKNLGFVFQDCNLLDSFSLRDNIFLPLVLGGESYRTMQQRLLPLAARLEISHLLDKYPYEVSGGEKQRAAAARALITAPKLLLADEPTGALDSRSSDRLMEMFGEINHDGQTILMVTHSARAASAAGRVLIIRDGMLHCEVSREGDREAYTRRIADTLAAVGGGRIA